MAFQFVEGRTNNHLTWVGVDSTDFATRESALSAAWRIKIYGTLEGATGINFVSSGTGSLTNDIQHVGASAAGVYHIALAKADLSDASAAWYDEYIVILSATAAAYETMVIEGVRTDTSYLSNVLSYLSNVTSDILSTLGSQFAVISNYLSNASNYLSNISLMVSDVDSQLLLNASMISDVDSQLLLNASMISDIQSALDSQFVVYGSDISDILSAVRGNSDTLSKMGGPEHIASLVWDADKGSYVGASTMGSVLQNVGTAGVTASDISNIASAVWSEKYNVYSAVNSSFGSFVTQQTQGLSNLTSYLSTTLSDFQSDFQSRITGVVTTFAQMSNFHSDLRSLTSGVGGGTASNLASVIWGYPYSDVTTASTMGSMLRVVGSVVSDAHSAAILAASHASDAYSVALINRSLISDVDSQLLLNASMISDIDSQLLLNASMISDVQSALDSQFAYLSNAISDAHSDLRSQISGITASVSASDISDIASRVWSEKYGAHSLASSFGSLFSLMATGVDNTESRTLRTMSDTSEILSTMNSQFAVTSNYLSNASNYLSNISALLSDVDSQLLLNASMISDVDSQLLLNASVISDIQSALDSQFAWTSNFLSGVSGAISDIESQLDLTASTVSDVESQLDVTQSQVSDIYSLLSDFNSNFGSRVPGVLLTSTDTLTELTSASAPDATPTLANAVMLQYMALRNKLTTTASRMHIHNDASAAIASAILSDDGTTFTRGEFS
jgi:hypothetical protein